MSDIFLHNTLTRQKERFTPLNADHVTMYVCGPTVYDHPHLGNARAVVVYDILYRLLKKQYPAVTYVRNITDVDDKINEAARQKNETIGALTKRITEFFHDDMAYLANLPPTIEPRATAHIAEMIHIIQLLLERDIAYQANNHIYFSVRSDPHYGQLSGRHIDDLIAGSRIDIELGKRDPLDFVLWKPADQDDDPSSVFDSPFGPGRPGWHIECSAMSMRYLGTDFDIHGGGADLMFPHHTNEIAQSCMAHPGSRFARYWVHNGFLTVKGEKMSKSLGNFTTVRQLREQGIPGDVVRLGLLGTHYRKPLDWNDKLLNDSQKTIESFVEIIDETLPNLIWEQATNHQNASFPLNPSYQEVMDCLADDLNTPKAISCLHQMAKMVRRETDDQQKQLLAYQLLQANQMMGLLINKPIRLCKNTPDEAFILEKIAQRSAAKKQKQFADADHIRQQLLDQGVILEDVPGGLTNWKYRNNL
jgi:cysteinyl-tRNA synthetase